jgi:uncharacterized protein (DUF2384 family)
MAKMETSTKKAAMPASDILGASITGPRIRSRDVFTMSEKPLAVMTPLEKMELVMEGVSKKELEQLKDITEMDYDRWRKRFPYEGNTYILKVKKERRNFGMGLSEKIVGLAIFILTAIVFLKMQDRFNQWVMRSNKALGGQAPFDLLNNQFGREGK